ncbi:MAG: hypothetical protein NVS4B10_12940 [Myxococcales bacterium]
MAAHHSVLIVGGGTGGLCIAARLRNLANPPDVGILEPSERHFYQPIWTLVGAGVFPKEVSERKEADFIPEGATWIRDGVAEFDPKNSAVVTSKGERITYEQLVVAAGIQLDWGKIKGLEGNVGRNGICSNYLYDQCDKTWETLQAFTGGNALFTFPSAHQVCRRAAEDHVPGR